MYFDSAQKIMMVRRRRSASSQACAAALAALPRRPQAGAHPRGSALGAPWSAPADRQLTGGALGPAVDTERHAVRARRLQGPEGGAHAVATPQPDAHLGVHRPLRRHNSRALYYLLTLSCPPRPRPNPTLTRPRRRQATTRRRTCSGRWSRSTASSARRVRARPQAALEHLRRGSRAVGCRRRIGGAAWLSAPPPPRPRQACSTSMRRNASARSTSTSTGSERATCARSHPPLPRRRP